MSNPITPLGLKEELGLYYLSDGSIDTGKARTILKNRWKMLAIAHHPDKGGDGVFLSIVNNAYDIIKDSGDELLGEKIKQFIEGEENPEELARALGTIEDLEEKIKERETAITESRATLDSLGIYSPDRVLYEDSDRTITIGNASTEIADLVKQFFQAADILKERYTQKREEAKKRRSELERKKQEVEKLKDPNQNISIPINETKNRIANLRGKINESYSSRGLSYFIIPLSLALGFSGLIGGLYRCDGGTCSQTSSGCLHFKREMGGSQTSSWQSNNAPRPTAEVCDGIDNDLDGKTDEGLLEYRKNPTCFGQRYFCRDGKWYHFSPHVCIKPTN